MQSNLFTLINLEEKKENDVLIESSAFFHPEHCYYKNNYYL